MELLGMFVIKTIVNLSIYSLLIARLNLDEQLEYKSSYNNLCEIKYDVYIYIYVLMCVLYTFDACRYVDA